jgi:hypothetical protein
VRHDAGDPERSVKRSTTRASGSMVCCSSTRQFRQPRASTTLTALDSTEERFSRTSRVSACRIRAAPVTQVKETQPLTCRDVSRRTRPPEPCAQVRILSGAPCAMSRDTVHRCRGTSFTFLVVAGSPGWGPGAVHGGVRRRR